MSARTVMPIMGASLLSEIPWAFIAPHDAQARSNHSQSLERLAQRGGLGASEALDIVEGRKWASTADGIKSEHRLINLVRAWRAATKDAKFHVGGKYNWKGQPERLVYMGRNWSGNGFWNQFAKVEYPTIVWCEVLDADLKHFEETQP